MQLLVLFKQLFQPINDGVTCIILTLSLRLRLTNKNIISIKHFIISQIYNSKGLLQKINIHLLLWTKKSKNCVCDNIYMLYVSKGQYSSLV